MSRILGTKVLATVSGSSQIMLNIFLFWSDAPLQKQHVKLIFKRSINNMYTWYSGEDIPETIEYLWENNQNVGKTIKKLGYLRVFLFYQDFPKGNVISEVIGEGNLCFYLRRRSVRTIPGEAVWIPTLDPLHSFNSEPCSWRRPHFVAPYLQIICLRLSSTIYVNFPLLLRIVGSVK